MERKGNTIGIIGGSGPDATGLLYLKIFEIARGVYGKHRLEDYPHLLINSIPLLQDVHNEAELNEVIDTLVYAGHTLKMAGADKLCFACNTHHLSLNIVRQKVGLPFISMIDAAVDKIKKENYKKVAIIGTSYSLNQSLYAKPLSEHGVEIVDLSQELVEKSHSLIANALAEIPDELTNKYVDFVNEIKQNDSFDALVLGCTEYSVLHDRFTKNNNGKSFPNISVIDPLSELALEITKNCYKE